MNKVVEFLNANPVQYLATVGRDGKAKCRPFMFAGELDGKLWFCTNNTKDVYKDMRENPEIEISVSSPEYAWIRLHGKAVFEHNMAAKEMCIQNPIVKGQYLSLIHIWSCLLTRLFLRRTAPRIGRSGDPAALVDILRRNALFKGFYGNTCVAQGVIEQIPHIRSR